MLGNMRQDKHDSGNSEKDLIKLLTKVLDDFFKVQNNAIECLTARLSSLETSNAAILETIMTALETLQASIDANTKGQADLTTAVNEAITRIGTPSASDATLLSLATLVDSSTASDTALAAGLRAALGTVVVPPVVP